MNKKVNSEKKKVKKVIDGRGQINIFSSFNNTIIIITRDNGDKLFQVSPRSIGKEYRGAKKSTAYAAQKVAEVILARAVELGIFLVKIKARGIGVGRDAAVEKLCNSKDLQVEELIDLTGEPHNGCRSPKQPRK